MISDGCGRCLGLRSISSRTLVYGLIGDPVNHSISPIIQNTAFCHVGFDAVYVTFEVKKQFLESAVAGVIALGVRGFNVTIPHKIRIMRYIDSFDREALKIGSVNTVVNSRGSLTGFNTDGRGALQSVGMEGLKGSSVLLLGAGGAARAIAHTFAPEVRRIIIVNRTISNARQLKRALNRRYRCEVLSVQLNQRRLRELVDNSELIVNASSMGMNGRNDAPIKRGWLHANQIVFDIVYTPPVTALLTNARRAGARTIDGMEMLLNQGAISFNLWTGKNAPITQMRRALTRIMTNYANS